MNQPQFTEHERAWAYLSRVVEGPSRTLQGFLAAGKEPEAIARGIKQREPWLDTLLKETASRFQRDRAETDLQEAAQLGARLITAEDPEWPAAELNTAFRFAASGTSPHVRSYQSDAVAPHALWVRGQPLGALVARSVALVGTRAMDRYGYQVANMLVPGLIAHEYTIVSGGALGADTAAHEAALAASGRTVAVAACGLTVPYPARNARLFERIAERGALISEYPPGVRPARHRFLTRNRLVAALTQGTVVLQAAWRSGALNTLSWAAGLGRVAMAVPGPVTSQGSLGCHERIRNGEAQLVVSADEIRGLIGTLGDVDAVQQYEFAFAPSPVQQLSRTEMRVYDAMSEEAGRSAEDVASRAGLTVGLTVHVLVELTRKNLVRRSGVDWFRERVAPE